MPYIMLSPAMPRVLQIQSEICWAFRARHNLTKALKSGTNVDLKFEKKFAVICPHSAPLLQEATTPDRRLWGGTPINICVSAEHSTGGATGGESKTSNFVTFTPALGIIEKGCWALLAIELWTRLNWEPTPGLLALLSVTNFVSTIIDFGGGRTGHWIGTATPVGATAVDFLYICVQFNTEFMGRQP